MGTISKEFRNRTDQLIADGKGELQAINIAQKEFFFQIKHIFVFPLKYLFTDLSSCEFRHYNYPTIYGFIL